MERAKDQRYHSCSSINNLCQILNNNLYNQVNILLAQIIQMNDIIQLLSLEQVAMWIYQPEFLNGCWLTQKQFSEQLFPNVLDSHTIKSNMIIVYTLYALLLAQSDLSIVKQVLENIRCATLLPNDFLAHTNVQYFFYCYSRLFYEQFCTIIAIIIHHIYLSHFHGYLCCRTTVQVYIQLYLYRHHVPYHGNQINTHHMIDYNCNHSDQEKDILYQQQNH